MFLAILKGGALLKTKVFIVKVLIAVLLIMFIIFLKNMKETTIITPKNEEENGYFNYFDATEFGDNEVEPEPEDEEIEYLDEIIITDVEIIDWGILQNGDNPRLWVKVKNVNKTTIDLNMDVDLYKDDEKIFSTTTDKTTLYSPVILEGHEAILFTDTNVPKDQDLRAEFSQSVRAISDYDEVNLALENSYQDGKTIHFDIKTNEKNYRSLWADVLCYKDNKLVEFNTKRLRKTERPTGLTVECTEDFDYYEIILNIFK